MSNEQPPSLPRSQVWVLAARPKTLPAAAAPVVLGTALALHDGVFHWPSALAALLGALLIQIGTNLANDYFDFKQGADTHERLGPLRVTQAGLLPPEIVARGMWATFALATAIGGYLVFVAGWPVVLIGLFSILAGIAYTGGPYPLGYNGLGDLFVFIFFGLVAVGGTYYVQALALTSEVLLASIPIGLLATAILVVNNLRDIETDKKAGKGTLAVRLGERGTRTEYALLLSLAYMLPAWMVVTRIAPPEILLVFLSLFRAVPLAQMVFREKGRPLNKALAGTGRLELDYAVLFSIGFLLSLL